MSTTKKQKAKATESVQDESAQAPIVEATVPATEQAIDLERFPLEPEAYRYSKAKDEDGRSLQDFVSFGALRVLALARGSQICLQELQEMFGRDTTAPADVTCATTGQRFIPRRWVILTGGEVLKDRKTGQPIIAGNFVPRFGPDGKAVVAGGSGSPFEKGGALANLRTVKTVRVKDGIAVVTATFEKPLPSLTYAAATAKAEALNAALEQKKADAEAERKRQTNAGLARLGEFVARGRSTGRGRR